MEGALFPAAGVWVAADETGFAEFRRGWSAADAECD